MESKPSFDSLPKEIVQQIFSYLDARVTHQARFTNRLFRTLLIRTDFVTRVNVDLAFMCNWLLEHCSTTLIGLNIFSRSSLDEIAENISKLTNLSSLQSVQFTSDDQWFKLTTLTNLYYYDSAGYAPSSVVPHWSKLTSITCAFGPKHKPDFPFSKLQALRRLALSWPDVDLSQNTNLTSLDFRRARLPSGLSNLVKLRQFMLDWSSTESSFFSALTDLEYLQINCLRMASQGDSKLLQCINSSRLTCLCMFVFHQNSYGDLSRLTSLKELTINEYEPTLQSSGRINMTLLTNLTVVDVQTININDFEGVIKLTNLQFLSMQFLSERDFSILNASFSALTKIDTLKLKAIHVPTIESDLSHMNNLTNLFVRLRDNSDYKFFETAPLKLFNNQGHVECDQFWSSLTKCTTLESISHTCEAPEDSVIWSLTSLSNLKYLSLQYTGRINEQYFTLLTNLRTLELKPLFGGVPIDFDWFQQQMTWLDDLYYDSE